MSIFMKLANSTGNSTDAHHQGWIDILCVNWGIKRGITAATGTNRNRESTSASVSEITLIKRADNATPALFAESCCGTGQEIELHFCKNSQGYGADTYLGYVLKNAIISGYRLKAHKDDLTRPNEEIKISFTAIETRYTPHDDKGTAQASIMMGYDLTTATST